MKQFANVFLGLSGGNCRGEIGAFTYTVRVSIVLSTNPVPTASGPPPEKGKGREGNTPRKRAKQ